MAIDVMQNRTGGFTLLEVLTVLFIISILSLVVIGRSDHGHANLLATTEVIKSHTRYAQSRSMDSDRRWGIGIAASGHAYWLFVDGETNKRLLPGETSNMVDLAGKGLSLTAAIISFNDRGQPCSDDSGTLLLTDDVDLVLSNGSTATTIRVTRNTGFIP